MSSIKLYGAVETNNFIVFSGFCKKIYTSTKQEINVFIDEKYVDTITSDIYINDIERKYEVFDNEGFCFKYEIPHQYHGKKHKIEFKSKNETNLLGSPLYTQNRSEDSYNKNLFDYSLTKKIDKEKIKDLYTKNSIGFIVNDLNINNTCFIEYIKDIYKSSENIVFKIFYFNEKQKKQVKSIFSTELNKIEFITPIDMYEVAKEIEIFIEIDNHISKRIVEWLIEYNNNLTLILYPENEETKNLKICDIKNMNTKTFEILNYLNIEEDILRKYESFIISIWVDFFEKNNISHRFNHQMTLSEYCKFVIEMISSSEVSKKYINKINYLYYLHYSK